MGTLMTTKIWANSGDAHVLEPPELWTDVLPRDLAERMPWTERLDEKTEVIHVDGQSYRRRLPYNPVLTQEDLAAAGLSGRGREVGVRVRDMQGHPPGARDFALRLEDLDQEGIWGEVVYPSVGMWNGLIKDPTLYREGVKAMNNWLKQSIVDVTPRMVPAAEISVLSVNDAVVETKRVAGMGFKIISLPTTLDESGPNWNDDMWEPLWATAEDCGLVIGFHVGSDAKDPSGDGNRAFRGPGGAVLNYVETTFGGQRAAMMMVTSGALDRHQDLKVLISEGGASWVPAIADRMDEGYRQHGVYVRPKLSRLPSEIIYEQVYTSFQHDKSAVTAFTAMGYKNVMWGSDYPHIEGTFGHTQDTLHQLFDGADEATLYRITRGAFLELFPQVGEPPQAPPVGEHR